MPLAGKPDAVECSPVINFGSEVFATEQGAFGGKLYAAAQQNNIVGTKIYQMFGYYGGLSAQNNIYWYDYVTHETGSIGPGGLAISAVAENCSVAVDGIIYSFGGYTLTEAVSREIRSFNTVTNTHSSLGAIAYSRGAGMFCAYKDGKIYFGGGMSSSQTSSSALFSFNIATNEVTTLISNMQLYAAHSSAIFIGDDLYVVGCNSSSTNPNSQVYKINVQAGTKEFVLQLPANYYAPVVACFDNRHIYVLGGTPSTSVTAPSLKIDTVTKTYEQLSDNFDKYSFSAAHGISGSKIYILGGGPSYRLQPSTNAIRSFTAQSDLQSNHLLLQEDYGYDGLWSALKSKDTDLKVKVINAYLGDSNNIAQLTNAYLYDTASQSWKSLSGESYVADMQNALNILGVT